MRTLTAVPISPAAFAPFGEVIAPGCDVALDLSEGTPRFSILALTRTGLGFAQITRHQRVTQCLGALGGKHWYLGVAAPGTDPARDPEAVTVFHIPGDTVIKLHRGTWHAGPLFDHHRVEFTNLELADTNDSDHDTVQLTDQYEITVSGGNPGFYTDAMRDAQELFESRRLADRLGELIVSDTINADTRVSIEAASMVFLATATADGAPEVSYKGGRPGFVRVIDERTIAFPFYDGNGMFRSVGNMMANPRVGLLFVDWDKPWRKRFNGTASIHLDAESLAMFPGAQLVVRVATTALFDNCGRYIHDHKTGKINAFVPDENGDAPQPEWKQMPVFADVLPGH